MRIENEQLLGLLRDEVHHDNYDDKAKRLYKKKNKAQIMEIPEQIFEVMKQSEYSFDNNS